MSTSPIIRRNSELLEAEVEGELIGLHVDNGTCYGFNVTATRIWALIEQPKSLDEICSVLTAEFDIDRTSCEQEVIALLWELQDEGLVEAEGVLPARHD